ncbi:MAG: PhnD/SsuA/transferrin family substrate-binding protein [Ahrensia sp.]
MRQSSHISALAMAGLIASTALSATHAMADEAWRAQNPIFVIGVARDSSAPRGAEQYERFRRVVEQAINMPVDIFVGANLASLIDAHASGRVDYAAMPLLGYYTANSLCDCSEPLVAPTTEDGATGIRSVLLVKPGTVNRIGDLSGRTIAYGPAASLHGSLVPQVEFLFDGKPLMQSGLSLVETDSFEATLALLNAGEADAAFGWSYANANTTATFDDSFATRAKQSYNMDLVPLWESQALPLGPHLIGRDVPDSIKRALRETMLSLHTQHPLAFDEISPQLAGPLRSVNAFEYREALTIIDQAQPR